MNARPSYPYVLMPPRLEAALNARPELAQYGLPRPQEESFPPDIPPGKSLLATLYTALRLKTQAEELTAPERQAARVRFEAAVREYEEARRAFEAAEEAKVTPEKLRAFRQGQVAALLESSTPESLGESVARPGVAEAHLFEYLLLHFPGRVLRRRMLGSGRQTYHPDYLYFDPAHRLRIDIELDEAYALGHKLPIHFVEEDPVSGSYRSGDDARDQAFLAAGWPVIRFSEEQAVENPDGCARVIADVIERLTGEKTPSLADVLPVVAHPRWTRQEANLMAAENVRVELTANIKRVVDKPRPRVQRVFRPSPNQQVIFDFLEQGKGHGLVVAVAGSGKSTTLLEAVRVILRRNPGARIILLAFNTSIEAELSTKLKEAGVEGVSTATLNGFGMQVIRRSRPGLKVDRQRDAGMLARAARELRGTGLSHEEMKQARNIYAKFQSYVHLDPHNLQDYVRLARQYKVADDGKLQPVVARALELAVRPEHLDGVSFDDQNYLPVKMNLDIRPYDFVFVDECQDLTQTQLEMVLGAAGDQGRLLFVGDPRQAIMGFRGADNDSVRNIKRRTGARELKLTVSYRCPQSHVKRARVLMPDIEAAEGAKEGEVHDEVPWADAFRYVQERDLLFARYNNLVDQAVLELLAEGLSVDYVAIQSKSTKRSEEEEDNADAERVSAVVAELRRLAPNFDLASAPRRRPSVGFKEKPVDVLAPWVLGRLYKQAQRRDDGETFAAYVESVTAPDPRLGVRVCSAHRAKGLEADRVFVMGYDLFGKPRQDYQDWQWEQEENLKYVALTRAKDTMFLVKPPL